MSTVGLLLAAGAGRRMGGPKALLRPVPGGPTLLERAVTTLRAAGLERVVAVVGAAAEDAAALATASGCEVVRAVGWEEGMGASLRAGLGSLGAGTGDEGATVLALVTLVDLPDLTPAVLTRVLEAASAGGPAALVRAAYDGVPGHPVAIGRDHWAGVTAAATGDRGARDYLDATAHLRVECGDLATGRDLDAPGDLDRGE